MEARWLAWVRRLQAIAQNGLMFSCVQSVRAFPAAGHGLFALSEHNPCNRSESSKSDNMRHATLPPAVPRLQTPRLVLRALGPGDADDIFAYAADPEVARYTLWHTHTSIQESRQFIAWLTRVSMACWAFVHPDTGHVIGTSVLHSYHAQHQRAEIAFNLAKALWGRGYATEAARAVIRAGFMHYGLNRIEGTCMLGNVASARVMEKVGMRFEGILRQYVYTKNAFHDMQLYAILRADMQ